MTDHPRSYFAIPNMGNVCLTKHAEDRMQALGISYDTVEQVLCRGTVVIEDNKIWREKDNVRIVMVWEPVPGPADWWPRWLAVSVHTVGNRQPMRFHGKARRGKFANIKGR